jgi:hypothetical protein
VADGRYGGGIIWVGMGFYAMVFTAWSLFAIGICFYRVYIIPPASGAEQYDHETLSIPSFHACDFGPILDSLPK